MLAMIKSSIDSKKWYSHLAGQMVAVKKTEVKICDHEYKMPLYEIISGTYIDQLISIDDIQILEIEEGGKDTLESKFVTADSYLGLRYAHPEAVGIRREQDGSWTGLLL